jgi:hypothetical protein
MVEWPLFSYVRKSDLRIDLKAVGQVPSNPPQLSDRIRSIERIFAIIRWGWGMATDAAMDVPGTQVARAESGSGEK